MTNLLSVHSARIYFYFDLFFSFWSFGENVDMHFFFTVATLSMFTFVPLFLMLISDLIESSAISPLRWVKKSSQPSSQDPKPPLPPLGGALAIFPNGPNPTQTTNLNQRNHYPIKPINPSFITKAKQSEFEEILFTQWKDMNDDPATPAQIINNFLCLVVYPELPMTSNILVGPVLDAVARRPFPSQIRRAELIWDFIHRDIHTLKPTQVLYSKMMSIYLSPFKNNRRSSKIMYAHADRIQCFKNGAKLVDEWVYQYRTDKVSLQVSESNIIDISSYPYITSILLIAQFNLYVNLIAIHNRDI